MGAWSLIYGLCYHNFNLKYERVCCILTKYMYNNYIYIYILYSLYSSICLKCTKILKINAGNSLSVLPRAKATYSTGLGVLRCAAD